MIPQIVLSEHNCAFSIGDRVAIAVRGDLFNESGTIIDIHLTIGKNIICVVEFDEPINDCSKFWPSELKKIK